MSLADQIIEHGPYIAGGTIPHELQSLNWRAAQINELRDEMIAARALKDRLGWFQIDAAAPPADGGLIWLTCDRCPGWHVEFYGTADLAELVQRAGEHTEVCR